MIYSSVVSFILIEASLIPEGRRSSWIFISFVIIPSFWYPGPLLINCLCSSFFNLLVGICHLLCMKFHPCIQDVLSLLALESFLISSSMRQLLVQVSHNLLLSSSFGHSLLLLFFFLLRVEFSRKWFLLLVSQSLIIVSSRLQLSFQNYPIHFLVFFACL
jgi:hypothetical protein